MSVVKDVEAANYIAYSKPSERPGFLDSINKGFFNEYSYIFRCTNEIINSKAYTDCLKDRKKVLSTIASGDQIINSILYGAKDIEGFDISVFPKYYLNLKIAAIKNLKVEDFLEFFYGRNAFNKEIYKKISKDLNNNNRLFWDTLINNKNRNKLVSSELFCTEFVDKNDARFYNPYLDEENYKELQSKIRNINLRTYDGDVFKLCNKLRKGYDLVNLSSIVVITDIIPPGIEKQKRLYKNFSLNDNGITMSYVFNTEFNNRYAGWEKLPNDEDYYYKDVVDMDGRKDDGIIVYKKLKN